ncbi:hypothetical protein Y032_0010g964 [Ancylostoma ceylanicum]|uniref:Uncharacterized protein n=1 Tax=Ancylostoma ceylanicum TaxID=53326 RepID=A0A016VHK3_9BILA|nr:hypothetical protein Y032_0010g964 [Ancylostoma ceylanicum]
MRCPIWRNGRKNGNCRYLLRKQLRLQLIKGNLTPPTTSMAPLKTVEEVRDLGFILTDKLGFDNHYKTLVRKATFRIYNLFKALKTRDPKKAYQSL